MSGVQWSTEECVLPWFEDEGLAISEAAAAVTTDLAKALFSSIGSFFTLQAIFSASYSLSPSSPSGKSGVEGEGDRFSPILSNLMKNMMKYG